MSLDQQITYTQLLQRHTQIQVPIIQRDYAQGRPDEQEVRDTFLAALEEALLKPTHDASLPLNLDFIYGSVEARQGKTHFLPLDGQQRLTTLFLLHWYLAWRDGAWDVFTALFVSEGKSRFCYGVRPSSNDFFDQLVAYRPTEAVDEEASLTALVCDQPWLFRSWLRDPTIQSALGMIDAIHKRFAKHSDLFARLMDESRPAITFQLLDLHDFGLSDDLYIKMNARGKPLTAFENFKARYEELLKTQFTDRSFSIRDQSFPGHEYVAIQLDTQWGDLFWQFRDKVNNLFDQAFLRLFRAVALVTRDPGGEAFNNDTELLRNAYKKLSFHDYHLGHWLDERFSLSLIHLLNALKVEDNRLSTGLLSGLFFDESSVLGQIIHPSNSYTSLSYSEAVQFAAYVGFLHKHEGKPEQEAFDHWMRVIKNLSVNTTYNRVADFRRSIESVNVLLVHADGILEYLANPDNPVEGFNRVQINEERIKCALLLAHDGWGPLITAAETHGYFDGQIDFLLEFTGVTEAFKAEAPRNWVADKHRDFLNDFACYWDWACTTFSSTGLKNLGQFCWQRALLSLGDYLLPKGRNQSFLVDRADDEVSWKRFLRTPEKRGLLKELWDRMKLGVDLLAQLEQIIVSSSGGEGWRSLIVSTPEIMTFSEGRSIRFESSERIYILKRSQLNGEHAELFTFYLYQKLKANQQARSNMRIVYVTATGTAFMPYIKLTCSQSVGWPDFTIIADRNQYRLSATSLIEEIDPRVASMLGQIGYRQEDGYFQKVTGYGEVEIALTQLNDCISASPLTTESLLLS
ncbi:DUF262 domain-containing protein [Aquitalea magnusonii]|uniref:Uncharacterized protein DUF262 n=1 Tax=Aquitalea magnusonii TaxID=332411 RepID=A0A318J5K3_9NEIS|nr:DUF262 domain-containing protein [Aquitalea magnusonii]PXX42970.1 uncharacterized protein DUF262 [Aquitalea magnusonii]